MKADDAKHVAGLVDRRRGLLRMLEPIEREVCRARLNPKRGESDTYQETVKEPRKHYICEKPNYDGHVFNMYGPGFESCGELPDELVKLYVNMQLAKVERELLQLGVVL